MTPARIGAATTIAEARAHLRAAFAAAGLDDADADARALIADALGCSPADLILRAETPLGERAARVEAHMRRRLAREPVARIRGRREFWGLDLALTPATLVPRPDTETLVEAVLAARPDRTQPLRILDLGTGSGALIAALLREYPAATGVAVDRSRDALATARGNLATLALDGRAMTVCGDWGTALAGGFDVVVSNPPYIASAEIDTLAPEVRAHDPRAALDGGPDGLAAYRAIAGDLPRLLAPAGLAAVEIGLGQAADVAALLTAVGLAVLETRRDLAGLERVVAARRRR